MILLQVLLIALNAVFACAEIAVLSVSENKLQKMAEEGNRRAKRLFKLTKQPARFLATIQVAITLSGFLGSAFAAENFADLIVNGLIRAGIGISPDALRTVAVILITLILSYFTLVFGELVPKRVAMRKSESLALGLSAPLTVIATLFAPLVWLLTVSTNGVLRLMGIDPNQNDEEVSEEDIRLMVDVGSQKGAIDSTEHEFIQNVFEFDDLTAGEISTHRTDVAMLWAEDSLEIWDSTVHSNRFTFYPVCRESQDNIIGILNAKDYFRLDPESRTKETVIRQAVKPAYLVPEGVKADVLFRNMKSTHNKFAIVIDEYGGMAGIVTMTDLLERLVGNISNDDAGQPGNGKEEAITDLGNGSWRVPGTASLTEVEKELGVTLNSDDSDTFGGLVFSALGTIPADGTTCEVTVDGLAVKIIKVLDHQLETAIVTVSQENDRTDKNDEKDAQGKNTVIKTP